MANNPFYVYLLLCSDGSYYAGITNDLEKRSKDHNDGKASKYTRSRRPTELVYSEIHKTRSAALQRECEIKKWSHAEKEDLVRGNAQ